MAVTETWRDLANVLTVELMAPPGKPAEGGQVKKEEQIKDDLTSLDLST